MKLRNLHDELYRAKRKEEKRKRTLQKQIEKQTLRQEKIKIQQERERLEIQDRILDTQIKAKINGTTPDYVKALKFKGITKLYLNLLGEDANKAFDKYFKEVGELKKNVDEAKSKLTDAMSHDENFQKLLIDSIENLKKKKEKSNQ